MEIGDPESGVIKTNYMNKFTLWNYSWFEWYFFEKPLQNKNLRRIEHQLFIVDDLKLKVIHFYKVEIFLYFLHLTMMNLRTSKKQP